MRIAIVVSVLLLAYAAVFVVMGLRTAHVAGRAFEKVKTPEDRHLILEAIKADRASDSWSTTFIGFGIEIAALLLIGFLIDMTGA